MNLPELFKYFVGVLFTSYFIWYIGCECSLLTHIAVLGALSIFSWTVAYYIYERANTETVSPQRRAVLITGCDSGFGLNLAQRLDQFGFTVFAAVLFPEGDGARALAAKCSSRLCIVRMDVTSEAEVTSVAKQIEESKIPLWAVVNNAGLGAGCPFDWGQDVDEYRRLFDVNVLGVVRVTKYLMPLLRLTSGSRVVNVASVAGRIAAPNMAHYCMAKHAVRVFSDVLRLECNARKAEPEVNEDVSVVVIEPIFYRTPMASVDALARQRERAFEQTPVHIQKAYNFNLRRKMDAATGTKINSMMRENVSEVVDAMEAAVTLLSPKLYYRCCSLGQVLSVFAVSHLPEVLLDWLVTLRG